MSMPILNLNEFFSELLPSERRKIIEPTLTRYGIAMVIGEMHWSLSTGTPFAASSSKNYRRFFRKISAGITVFYGRKTAVNFNSQGKFYDNGASAVLRRLTVESAELPAILEK